jgi:sec-independent protein translocase protein TatC
MINLRKRQKKELKLVKKVDQQQKTFLEHSQELRTRLIFVALFFIFTSTVGYLVYPSILSVLFHLYNQQLFYTTPTAGLDLAFKISVAFGFSASLPILGYEFFQFIKPAFSVHLHKSFLVIVLSSTLLLAIGMTFAYFVTLPATLRFLSSFGTTEVSYFVSVNSYISFVLQYLLVFGVIFQVPLILILLNSFLPMKVGQLMKYQTWVIVGSFTLAAIVTPTPDPINQTIMALPIIVLYETSIVIIFVLNRHKQKR